MPAPLYHKLIASRWVERALYIAAGALGTRALTAYLRRTRYLDLRVQHQNIGFTTTDANFGNIAIHLQGAQVDNLWLTTVVIRNDTTRDYTGLIFRVRAINSQLLTEEVGIGGSTFPVLWTTPYANSLAPTPAGTSPEQYQIWHAYRDYDIPVFNRNQQFTARYLTTVPGATTPPNVHAELRHPGLSIKDNSSQIFVHGVPLKIALSIGLSACAAAFAVCILSPIPPWAAMLTLLILGLVAQLVGSLLYRLFRMMNKLF